MFYFSRLLSVIFLSILISSSSFAKISQETYASWVNVGKDPSSGEYEFQGLTAEGVEELKRLRDILIQRDTLFNNKYKNLSDVYKTGMIARMAKGHMFLYGPPGGAKSALVDFILSSERSPSFKLQMHQMMTEQPFVGGQDFEDAKRGKYTLNTEGALADFVTGFIDEVDKGNPAAIAALLSLLNERKVFAGGEEIDAPTETVFATSNANLPEIFQAFVENGQGSTAPALFNRFLFKAFVYNWLKPEDQAALSELANKKRSLKALAKIKPAILSAQEFVEPEELSDNDWEALRFFADILIVLDNSNMFETGYNDFSNKMRAVTLKAVRESEERHMQNRYDEPFVYFPSFDPSERLRQQISPVIAYSAFYDFLLSNEASDDNIESSTAKQIVLSPLSLWRAFLVMTTIGPGNTALSVDKEGKVSIDFGLDINEDQARDARERLLIANLKNEQRRFRAVFESLMGDFSELLQNYSVSVGPYGELNIEAGVDADFEIRILN